MKLKFFFFVALLLSFVFADDDCTTLESIDGKVCVQCKDKPTQCTGCDGLIETPTSPALTFDLCGVCNGDGTTCIGCDGSMSFGRNYDICGVCGGDGSSCASASQTESVTFGPTPSGTTQVVYKLPLIVKLSSKTAGAKIYYSIQSLNANDTLPPPNWYSPTGDTITLNHNATIKAFAFLNSLKVSYVSTGLFLVSPTGKDPNVVEKPPLLIPAYAIAIIVVGGVVLVVAIVAIVLLVNINRRKKMIAINLEANEASVKENNYRALYEYKPTRDDELELKVGDVVNVISKQEDGWWEGKSYRLKGKTGFFPGNYVEELPAERLMWVERPKTAYGRFTQRMSNFFGGGPSYGTDPQLTQNQNSFAGRVSRMFGQQPKHHNNQSQSDLVPKVPPKPTNNLPPRPKMQPDQHY